MCGSKKWCKNDASRNPQNDICFPGQVDDRDCDYRLLRNSYALGTGALGAGGVSGRNTRNWALLDAANGGQAILYTMELVSAAAGWPRSLRPRTTRHRSHCIPLGYMEFGVGLDSELGTVFCL